MNKSEKLTEIIILAIFLLVSNAEAATISSCTTISAPGTYTLTGDLLKKTGNPCILITSSDVTIDGAGHLLDGNKSSNAAIAAIKAYSQQTALTNVNIKNLRITNWTYGIYYKATILSNLSNNDIRETSYGFYFDEYSGKNTFIGNNLSNKNGYGFYMYQVGYNTFTSNKLNSNSIGIYLVTSNNNTLTDNVANGNTNAFYLSSSKYNILKRNTATYTGSSSGTGFNLASSGNNILDGNKATTYYGFSLGSSDNNTLSNNNASGQTGQTGINLYFTSSHNNTVINNTANAKQYGVYLSNANYNKIIRTTVKGVAQYGIYSYNSKNNQIYDNLFNNINNFYLYSSTNIWNIPPWSAINIVNGLYTAGNVWENPTKTGFSQICSDADLNGICDSAYPLDASNIDNKPLVHHPDNTIPKSVTNLRNITYQDSYIKWTWTDPTDTDFSYVKIYLDGIFKAGVLHGVQAYNATGLLPNTSHTIGIKTVDINGNENATTKTHTAWTKRDSTPPASVTNLKNTTYKPTYITWTWTDPTTYDFTLVKIYINGVFKADVLKGKQSYNSTGLTPNTLYGIGTRTMDASGNIGAWLNKTARTAP